MYGMVERRGVGGGVVVVVREGEESGRGGGVVGGGNGGRERGEGGRKAYRQTQCPETRQQWDRGGCQV